MNPMSLKSFQLSKEISPIVCSRRLFGQFWQRQVVMVSLWETVRFFQAFPRSDTQCGEWHLNSVLGFCCYDGQDPEQCAEETTHTSESCTMPLLREVRAGTWRTELNHKPWRSVAYWLGPHGFLSYTLQGHWPRGGTTSILNQENALQAGPEGKLLEEFSQLCFPQNDSRLCQVDIQLASTLSTQWHGHL